MLDGDPRRCVELVAEVMNQGRDLSRLCRDLVEHFRNLLVARLSASRAGAARAGSADMAQLLDLPDQEIADLIRQSSHVSVESLLDYLDFIAAGDEEVGALGDAPLRPGSGADPLGESAAVVAGGGNSHPARTFRGAGIWRSTVCSCGGATQVCSDSRAGNEAGCYASAGNRSQRRLTMLRNGASSSPLSARKKRFLAPHLGTCSALSLPPAPFKVSVAERHHLGFLNDTDNLASLRELAKRFFGVDVTIQFVAAAVDVAPPASSDAARTEGAAEDRSEMVKEALRIFGGSVRSVRRENP